MTGTTFDVIVADPGLGSLAVAFDLARLGRTVGIVASQPLNGTTTVSASSARRVEPLRALVDAAPVVSRRAVKVLQPEGALSIEFASERLVEAGDAIVVVDRAAAQTALTAAIVALGGQVLPVAVEPVIDETGFVAGYRSAEGASWSARCTILGDVGVEQVSESDGGTSGTPAWAIESEWIYALASRQVTARFGLARRRAAEWWLYGGPLDGAAGFGRVRAFAGTVAIAVIVPLEQVWGGELSIESLGDRLRSHPSLAPLLTGSELVEVAGWTNPQGAPVVGRLVGDGWAAAPRTSAADLAPLTTELRMAAVIAQAVDEALGSPRVSAARLSGLPRRLGAISTASQLLPLGPIDGWADELVSSPGALAIGARMLAERFAGAG